jgi:hypothetical protein
VSAVEGGADASGYVWPGQGGAPLAADEGAIEFRNRGAYVVR